MSEITAQVALDLLRNSPEKYNTSDALKALADRISVDAKGGVTVLYSGNLGSIKDLAGNVLTPGLKNPVTV
ncbi:hypothetical protein [Herbaspirillum autotrophicum]|uniref:hypothetical protein n=1 Tax=Herbaspirillum autotrophicum TaxID=180195 RepID=UPI000A548DCB|nr:hypothetical protein [Herbaspirillum autotrophicum]